MAENIKLNRNGYDKNSYPKVIDTEFRELGVKTIEQQIQDQPSVQEFFNLYNELFYQINALGPTNSHEYLIKSSTEYIGFEENNEIIELLQAEIAALREELLETQKQLATIQIPETEPIQIPSVPDLPDPEPIVVETPPPPPQPSPTPPPTPTNTEKVIKDFETYPRSSNRKRAARLNLSKSFVKDVKKAYNL